ncbi:MAG: hypothetical protein ABFC56_04965 [Clostridiaceae bacterium]
MKQILQRQLTNIVFLVLIVAAALTIYLLSRAEKGVNAQAATPSAAQTATPAATPQKKDQTRGVPESVFTTYLATNEVFSAEKNRHDSRNYALAYGDSPQIKAALQYELLDGSLSSIEIVFPLAVQQKSKHPTDIEAYLEKAAVEQERALPDALLAILSDLLPACDAKDELQRSSVRYWSEQAMQLKKVGDDFEDSLGGYRFLAYRSQGETQQELVCILYLT